MNALNASNNKPAFPACTLLRECIECIECIDILQGTLLTPAAEQRSLFQAPAPRAQKTARRALRSLAPLYTTTRVDAASREGPREGVRRRWTCRSGRGWWICMARACRSSRQFPILPGCGRSLSWSRHAPVSRSRLRIDCLCKTAHPHHRKRLQGVAAV